MLKFVVSLQIMEAMALHLESSYEKLYRWSQGTLFAVAIHVQCMQSYSMYRIIQYLKEVSTIDLWSHLSRDKDLVSIDLQESHLSVEN